METKEMTREVRLKYWAGVMQERTESGQNIRQWCKERRMTLVDIEQFKADVQSVNWCSYREVSNTLIAIALADKESKDGIYQLDGVSTDFLSNAKIVTNVMSTIGNDHRGVYYPVARDALPFIIQVALFGNHMVARNCAINILINMFYFYPHDSDEELRDFVRNTIKVAIANNVKNFTQFALDDTRNSSLVECLFAIRDETA